MSTTTEPIKVINFDQLAGLKASLYYNNHLNQFQLGSVIFEVIEDENDGYRSMLQEVRIIDQNAPKYSGNFLGPVIIEKVYEGDFDGYHILDERDGHIWVTFGTSNYDDYYPNFVFNVTPKPN